MRPVGTPALISVPKFADQVGLRPRKVYLMIRTGEIASVQVGRLRLIPADEPAAWLARNLRPAKGTV